MLSSVHAHLVLRLENSLREKADAQDRSTFIISSNVENRRFYNSVGYVTVHTMDIGKDDPTWSEPPILVDIVSNPRLKVRWP